MVLKSSLQALLARQSQVRYSHNLSTKDSSNNYDEIMSTVLLEFLLSMERSIPFLYGRYVQQGRTRLPDADDNAIVHSFEAIIVLCYVQVR